MAQNAKAWISRKPGRTVRAGEAMTLLMIEKGAVVGSYYVEPYSPPSKAEPGQPKRQTA
jgi:hypothetical protein